MEVEDFWLLRKGWFGKLIYEEELIRLQTAIIYYSQPSFGKQRKTSFERLWPGKNKDKKPMVGEKQRKLLEKFRVQEALKKHNKDG